MTALLNAGWQSVFAAGLAMGWRWGGDGGGDGVAPPSDAPSAGLAPPLEKVALIYRFTAHF